MATASTTASHSAETNRYAWLRRGLLGVSLLLLLAAPALGGPSSSHAALALEPLPGDTDSFALEINNHGIAAGRSEGASGTSAVVWDRTGNPIELMPRAGDNDALAEGINNRGDVVGFSRSGQGACPADGFDTAVIWYKRGDPVDLPPLPGDLEARAFAISDSGEVVGTSLGPRGVGVPSPCEAIFTPVRWDRDGNPTELPVVPGFAEGFGNDINNRGVTVGGSIDFSFFPIGFIVGQMWDSDAVSGQLTLPAGNINGAANGINNNGVVVGETADVLSGIDDRALVWDRKGNATSLPPLAGDPTSAAQAINNRGAVAGSSGIDLIGFFGPPEGTAVIWNKAGVPTALDPLSGDTDSFGFGINDRGQVVGFSRDAAGTSTAVVWGTKEN